MPVFWKSLYQNKVDYLQKPISGLGRIVLPLIFLMDELSVHVALVVWYDFHSIYRQAFSAVVGIAKWSCQLRYALTGILEPQKAISPGSNPP